MRPDKPKKKVFFPNFRRSLHVLWNDTKFRRLFKEDKGVEGVGWYARYREDYWHVPLGVLRFVVLIIFAPIYAVFQLSPLSEPKGPNAPDIKESACIPDAMLYESPGYGEPGKFEPMGHPPRWMLEVTFQGPEEPIIKQVDVEGNREIMEAGYMAISYPMESAFELFKEVGLQTRDPQPNQNRRWSLRDQEQISRRVLYEFACARFHVGIPDSTEYIWLDELCLSPATLTDEGEVEKERMKELGRLADIFRNAKKVLVFCHSPGCKHTTLDCLWGQRVFTIAEILHAQHVITMTRYHGEGSATELIEQDGRNFKSEMQREAAEGGQFHLSTILLHATNAGSAPWQSVIHALVVEAIRRDEAGGYLGHNYLGKVLNGLLPRRARPQDLRGKDGWADLAWLLELNQGYYNAASLAAVCNVNLTPARQVEGVTAGQDGVCAAGYRWWGKPILPMVGNEWLEPVVTALPVVLGQSSVLEEDSEQEEDEPAPESKQEPVLAILAPKAIHIHHTLRRDRNGLYRHESMVCLRKCICAIAALESHVGIPFLIIHRQYFSRGALLMYLGFVLIVFVELLASTAYVVREGWVFLPDDEWGDDPSHVLGELDPRFKKLNEWGKRQLIPSWDPMSAADGENSGYRLVSGSLVDMNRRAYTKVMVIDGAHPDLMVMLAVHGTGITGLLLQKPYRDDDEEEAETSDTESDTDWGSIESDGEEHARVQVFTKVGMANVPAYVLTTSDDHGTIFVGGHLPVMPIQEAQLEEEKERTTPAPFQETQNCSASKEDTHTLPPATIPSDAEPAELVVKGQENVDLEKGRVDELKGALPAGEIS